MFFILFYLTSNCQINVDTITISDPVKFKRIPTCFGENCHIGNTCTLRVPGIVTTGYLKYDNVRIGKIQHCQMFCETRNGICYNTMIIVKDPESVKQAGQQAAKQFGEPTYSKEGSLYIYAWKYIPNKEKELNARLEVAADLQSAELFIE